MPSAMSWDTDCYAGAHTGEASPPAGGLGYRPFLPPSFSLAIVGRPPAAAGGMRTGLSEIHCCSAYRSSGLLILSHLTDALLMPPTLTGAHHQTQP